MAFKGNEYFWKDRKRYLGLPLSFTRYALSHDRLFLSVGFFSVRTMMFCCTASGIFP